MFKDKYHPRELKKRHIIYYLMKRDEIIDTEVTVISPCK